MDPQTKAQLAALQFVESSNNPNAVSPMGARGLMQVMPDTAADPGWGVEPSDGTPEDDVRVGRELFVALRDQEFDGDPELAAIAYNRGIGNTREWLDAGGNYEDLPAETQQHVSRFREQLALAGGTGEDELAPSEGQEDDIPSLEELLQYDPSEGQEEGIPSLEELLQYDPSEEQGDAVPSLEELLPRQVAEDFNKLSSFGKYEEHNKIIDAFKEWSKDPYMSDEDAIQGYKDYMRAFTSNSISLAEVSLRVGFGSDEDRANFAKMLSYWEDAELLSDGIESITGYILPALADPANLFSAFVGGKIATKLGAEAVKSGIKRYLIGAAAVAAVDAPLSVGFEAGIQNVKMKTGLQEDGDWDEGQLALAAAIGAGVPVAIHSGGVGAKKVLDWWTNSKTNKAAEEAIDMMDAEDVTLTRNLLEDIDNLTPEDFELPVFRENYGEQLARGEKPKASDPKLGRTVNSIYILSNMDRSVADLLEDMATTLGPKPKVTMKELNDHAKLKASGKIIEADAELGKKYKSPAAVARLQLEQSALVEMTNKSIEKIRKLIGDGVNPDEQQFIRAKMQSMLLYARTQEATSVLQGVRNEWGIMGQVFQNTQSLGRRASNVAMRALNDRYGSNFDAIVKDLVAGKYTVSDLNVKPSKDFQRLLLDSGTEWMYNVAMLSNPDTIVVNTIGPMFNIIAKNTEKTIGALFNLPGQALGFNKGGTNLADVGARWMDTGKTMKDAVTIMRLFSMQNNPLEKLNYEISALKQQVAAPNLSSKQRTALTDQISEKQRLLDMIVQSGRSEYRESGIRQGGAIGSGVPKWIANSALAKKHLPNLTQGGVGYLLRTPTRLMGGSDLFFRTIARAQALNEAASKAARAQGLQGQARVDFMKTYKPTGNELDVAMKQAEEIAFNQQNAVSSFITRGLGRMGGAENAAYKIGSFAIRSQIPFVTTPINLAMWMIDRTPAVGIFTSSMKGYDAGEIVGRQIVGATLMSIGAYLYENNMMTGMTDDWRMRATMEAAGESPLSLKNIFGLGPGEAFNFSRLDPVAAIVQSGALLTALYKEWAGAPDQEKAEISDMIEAVKASVAIYSQTFLTERTMLAGLFDMTKVLSGEYDLGQYAEKRAASLAGQMLAPPFLKRYLQAQDKSVRFTEGEEFGDAVMNNIRRGWGMNTDETAPPRSVYGEEVEWQGYPADWFPIGRGRKKPESAHLLAMHQEYNVPYKPTPKRIYGDFQLTPSERSIWEKTFGAFAKAPMEGLYELHARHKSYMKSLGFRNDYKDPAFSKDMQKLIADTQQKASTAADEALVEYLAENNPSRWNELTRKQEKKDFDDSYYFSKSRGSHGYSTPEQMKEGEDKE